MKHQLFITVSLLLAIFHGTAASADTGIKNEGNGKYTIQNHDLSMTVATDGGKILSFKYKDQEVISQTTFPNSFGSTFWTSPQKEWNWPPVAEFDRLPYEVELTDKLTMKSQVSQRLKYSLSKEFAIDEQDQAIVVSYGIKNESDEVRQVAPWEITRVPNDGMIFFDAAPSDITPAGLLDFKTAHGLSWYVADEAPQNRKVNADGKGWLAYCAKGLLLVKRFQDLSPAQPAPGEAEIQVYVNQRKTFIEIESQGAYTTLKPGEQLRWTVRWYLQPYEGSVEPSKQLKDATASHHWVGTWGTAPQLVERHNNPPAPGLANNSLRQIAQVSIGGETVRLKLTNEFSSAATEIKAVELACAKTAGSSSDIDESSTVSLTFGGKPSVTMAPGGRAVSDPVKLHLEPRQNIAITIHYGEASSTNVSGHPGSRTTSYLKAGNTTDFTDAVKTDHWYNILALEVEAPAEAGAVAILGNSITDGRGSTTNQQNRWADVLSRRLLSNKATRQVGVLNMGIGGNCVLRGGLGPTGSSRYQRDLLGQEGVKWIILFEAVNDLGYTRDGVQTAQRIIEVYEQIIREAHERGIRVFGGTITPFKGNNYYSADHEKGRSTINQWIRTTSLLDGVIDFDRAVRNPDDPEAMKSEFLFENDWLHFNAKGYEAMGKCIDLNLFTK